MLPNGVYVECVSKVKKKMGRVVEFVGAYHHALLDLLLRGWILSGFEFPSLYGVVVYVSVEVVGSHSVGVPDNIVTL